MGLTACLLIGSSWGPGVSVYVLGCVAIRCTKVQGYHVGVYPLNHVRCVFSKCLKKG